MPVAIACPKCKQKYKLPDSAMGKQLKCKSCGAVFKTKAPGASAANTIANTLEIGNVAPAAPQPSLKELAELGIGDLKQSGDVFAGAAMPPGQSLGSVVQDPGFGDFDIAREEVAEEKDAGMSAVLENPYLSPGGGKPLKKKKGPRKAFVNNTPYTYKPLTVHAWLLSIAVGINIIIGATLIIFLFLPPSLPVADPDNVDPGAIWVIIGAIGLVLLIYLFSIIAYLVMSMIFMYRANANARSLGAEEMVYSPGWCIGCWLIPFMNFYWPFNAMAELSRTARKPRGKSWAKMSIPLLPTAWWNCLMWGIIVRFVAGYLHDNDHIGSLTFQIITTCGDGLTIAAGVLLIFTVWDITKRQKEHAEKAGVA